MNDHSLPLPSLLSTVFTGVRGRIHLKFTPSTTFDALGPYEIKGAPEWDDRLVAWSLQAAGVTEEWFGDYMHAKGDIFFAKDNAKGEWSSYRVVAGRSCSTFVAYAIEVYIGRPWKPEQITMFDIAIQPSLLGDWHYVIPQYSADPVPDMPSGQELKEIQDQIFQRISPTVPTLLGTM